MMALVTGGASSGKSAYAEQLACILPGTRYYLAAMKPFGEEGARRISRHRALRAGKGFATIECYAGLRQALPDATAGAATALQADEQGAVSTDARPSEDEGRTVALFESLGNVVANALFADDGSCTQPAVALQNVMDEVRYAAMLFDDVVVVGDEAGGDGLSYDQATEAYIDVLGAAACAIAAKSDLVVECVAGCPLVVKDGRPHGRS